MACFVEAAPVFDHASAMAALFRLPDGDPDCHVQSAGRLAFDRTLPPTEALGRIRDAFHDYDGGVGGH